MTIWFATGNTHKKQELGAILPGHGIKTPAEGGIDFEPAETGNTFLENALIKARELHRLLGERGRGLGPGEAVIADDSGLCVDALGGRPGVFSARYAGKAGGGAGGKLGAAERNALLLEELGDEPRRSARFVCAMVLLLGGDRFFVAQETLEGEIVRQGRGAGGFGYDPLLYVPAEGATVAEMPEELKNRLSHRGKAGRVIAAILASLEAGERP
jgi:XTP/dITP diphosphohydrolase